MYSKKGINPVSFLQQPVKETWKLVVVIDSEKKRIAVPEDCRVSKLIEIVAKQASLDQKTIGLAYADQPELLTLEKYGLTNERLSHFGIQNGSVLMLVMRVLGGMWVIEAITEKRRTLEDLPGFITVTTDPKEPDMITLDDCPHNRRARMPCGHVIGPDSMTSYCRSLISEGKFIFQCPDMTKGRYCNREWPFTLVRHVACLTAEELEEVEENIVTNVLVKAKGIKQCPGCSNWCFRSDPANNCVACSVCTNKLEGNTYMFCWKCLGEWKRGRNDECGNSGCLDKRLLILAECEMKFIPGTDMCPSIRGCTECGQLIEHIDFCKHVRCKCGYAFCFYCLKPKNSARGSCSPYGKDCQLAPRQTALPNPKDDKFSVLHNSLSLGK